MRLSMNMNYKIALMLALAAASANSTNADTVTEAFTGEIISRAKSLPKNKIALKDLDDAAQAFKAVGRDKVFSDTAELLTKSGLTELKDQGKFKNQDDIEYNISESFKDFFDSAGLNALKNGSVTVAELVKIIGIAGPTDAASINTSIKKMGTKKDSKSMDAIPAANSALIAIKTAIDAAGTSYHKLANIGGNYRWFGSDKRDYLFFT